MKTHIKMGVLIFFLMIVSVAAFNSVQIHADTIDITQDGLYEYKDIQLEGHSYTAVYFAVSDYGTEQASIKLMGLRSEEKVLYIPSSIGNMRVVTVGGGGYYHVENTRYFAQAATNGSYFWTDKLDRNYKEVKIPSTVKRIEYLGAGEARVDKIIVPKTVEYIESMSGVREAILKGKNTTIASTTFAYSRLKKITFPPNYQGEIGSDAFAGSHIKSFVWPKYSKKDMKKKMGESVFRSCRELKKIIFPKNVKYVYVPRDCFTNASMLDSITFPKTVKEVVYDWQEAVAKNYVTAPSKLIFKGKNTKLKGIKATKHLSNYLVTNKEYYGVKLKNREFLCTGKIIAPKKSKAIRYAKKAYRFKDLKILRNWNSRGGEAFHLMKMKWAYLK